PAGRGRAASARLYRQRSTCDSNARTHTRSYCLAISESLSVHWRSSLVVDRARATLRIAELLLVRLEKTDTVDGALAGLRLRVGSCRPRAAAPRRKPRDEAVAYGLYFLDETVARALE